ncbi:MAG: type I-E CRISPR-associated endonuclease Cas1 [Bacillota bacterium]|nr:MAG: type I-E CRISPR-associated endonuclease Cas1 [Bacillota bacterium]
MRDLHELPKVRDGWSYLYVEHCRVDQDQKAIVLEDARGRVPVPCATLGLLMLGPGTLVTHAAVRTLADNGCLVAWSGEEGVRFYAQGMGETRSARNLLHQARLWASPELHLEVVFRLYQFRFDERLDPGLSLRQVRGMEGIRVRRAYQAASREYGVKWERRSYDRSAWARADPVNRALSAANSCLYGICHAAIVSAGYSPALGFIHTGKMLSFVYDVADLFKTEIAVPVAFREAADTSAGLESRVRRACRDAFYDSRILARVIPAVQEVLGIDDNPGNEASVDDGIFSPGGLWEPDHTLPGGVNFGGEEAAAGDGSDPRARAAKPERGDHEVDD